MTGTTLKETANSAFVTAASAAPDLLDRIVADPFSRLQLELKHAFLEKSFTQEKFDAFVTKLGALGDIRSQLPLVQEALAKGAVTHPFDIELKSPHKQLLWCATLTRLMDMGKSEDPEKVKTAADFGLWQQLLTHPTSYNQMVFTAQVIRRSLQNENVTYRWGQPDEWFYFDLKENNIVLDFYYSLLIGFENISSVFGHEIGHSELSQEFSGRMRAIADELDGEVDTKTTRGSETGGIGDKVDKDEDKEYTEEEINEILALYVEWKMRFELWHMTEDNCVNQFAVNVEQIMRLQNYGAALNNVSALLQGFGEIVMGDAEKWGLGISTDKPEAPVQIKKMQVGIEILEIELQESIDAGDPEKMTAYAERKKELLLRLEALIKLEEEIKAEYAYNTRPMTDDEADAARAGNISLLTAKKLFNTLKTTILLSFYEKNGLFQSPEMWDRQHIYPADFNRVLDLAHIPEAVGKTPFDYIRAVAVGDPDMPVELKKFPMARAAAENFLMNGVKIPVAVDKNTRKEDVIRLKAIAYAEHLGLSPDEEDSVAYLQKMTIRARGIRDLQPLPSDRHFGRAYYQAEVNACCQARCALMEKFWDEIMQPFAQVAAADRVNKMKEELKNPDQGGKPGNGKGGSPMPKKLRDALKNIKKKPSQSGQGSGKPSKESFGSDPKKNDTPRQVKDMADKEPVKDDLTPAEKAERKKALEQMNNNKGGSSSSSEGGRSATNLDLEALAKGDWNKFHARLLELMPIIKPLHQSYQMIMAMQMQTIKKMSDEHEIIPANGDYRGMLDMQRVIENRKREAMGLAPEIEDFNKFFIEKDVQIPSSVECISMIDGSGSMKGWAINAAIQSSVINYMAARMAGIDAYIIVWGDDKPLVLADPTTDFKMVGQRLEALRNGLEWGTALAPAFIGTLKSLAEHKAPPGTISGSSHVTIYSDGDIADPVKSKSMLHSIVKSGRNMTVDLALLRTGAKQEESCATQMEAVFEEVIKETGRRILGILRCDDPNAIPRKIMQSVLQRMRSTPVTLEPDEVKRRRFRNILQQLEKTQPKLEM